MNRDGVLLLTENVASGGINTYAISIAEGLRTRGVPVEIASVWPKPDNWLQVHCQQKGLVATLLAARLSHTMHERHGGAGEPFGDMRP